MEFPRTEDTGVARRASCVFEMISPHFSDLKIKGFAERPTIDFNRHVESTHASGFRLIQQTAKP